MAKSKKPTPRKLRPTQKSVKRKRYRGLADKNLLAPGSAFFDRMVAHFRAQGEISIIALRQYEKHLSWRDARTLIENMDAQDLLEPRNENRPRKFVPLVPTEPPPQKPTPPQLPEAALFVLDDDDRDVAIAGMKLIIRKSQRAILKTNSNDATPNDLFRAGAYILAEQAATRLLERLISHTQPQTSSDAPPTSP